MIKITLLSEGGDNIAILTKIEKHNISKCHPLFDICNDYCRRSKDLYNHANYIVRQEFIKSSNFLKYTNMQKIMKVEDSFKSIGSNSGQMTLKILEQNWKSYFVAIKDWSKNPHKYLGKPRLPNYLDKKRGRFVWVLTNVQSKIINGYLKFSFKPLHPYNNLIKTNVKGKHMQTRIVPKDGYYVLEIVYQTDIPEVKSTQDKILGIDLGLNNLMTVQNNFGHKPFVINGKPLKSINNYYNMKKSKIQSELKKVNGLNWSKRLAQLTMKRDNKIDNYLHKTSRWIVNYCKALDVDVVVIGKNNKWKQGFKRQRNFIMIPFNKLILHLEYKLAEIGVRVILTEESYTSKASFLDNDDMKKDIDFSGERIKRGLYKTRSSQLINADVNGASNIIRKVFPNAFRDGIKGVCLHPSIVNL